MLWAIPVGVALTLFAPALIHYVLGTKWTPATVLIQITGLIAALNHIGFNWDDYYRARADTRPLAVVALISALLTLGLGIPLVLTDGLTGVAWALGVGAASAFVVRTVYIGRLFGGVGLLLQAWRALLPALVAAVVVLALRATGAAGPGLLANALCLGVYGLIVLGGSAISERALLGEAYGYLLGRGRPSAR
jgi:O-antigen/teichoic acid export membrane protein